MSVPRVAPEALRSIFADLAESGRDISPEEERAIAGYRLEDLALAHLEIKARVDVLESWIKRAKELRDLGGRAIDRIRERELGQLDRDASTRAEHELYTMHIRTKESEVEIVGNARDLPPEWVDVDVEVVVRPKFDAIRERLEILEGKRRLVETLRANGEDTRAIEAEIEAEDIRCAGETIVRLKDPERYTVLVPRPAWKELVLKAQGAAIGVSPSAGSSSSESQSGRRRGPGSRKERTLPGKPGPEVADGNGS